MKRHSLKTRNFKLNFNKKIFQTDRSKENLKLNDKILIYWRSIQKIFWEKIIYKAVSSKC